MRGRTGKGADRQDRLTDKQIRDARRKNPVVTVEVASRVPVVDWQLRQPRRTHRKKEADVQMHIKDSQ